MQETGDLHWARKAIYIVNRNINLRPSRPKGGYSPYEAFFGKKIDKSPKDILDKDVVKHCLTEAALEAAVAFVQSEDITMEERLSPDFNSRIIEVIHRADAKEAEEDAVGSMKPSAAIAGEAEMGSTESAAVNVAEVGAKEQSIKPAAVEDFDKHVEAEEENAMKTGDSSIPSTPTRASASTHHQSDTPRRGEIRRTMAALQEKQARQINKKRKSSAYVEVLNVGDVCKIKVEGNTRAATDHAYLPVMVTQRKQSRSKKSTTYQVASRDGYLLGWYPRENLDLDPLWTAEMAGIDINADGFKSGLTIATASALYNVSGGATTCQCKSDCATNGRCTCKRAGNYCTSKCHGGRGKNVKCNNCKQAADEQKPPPGSSNLCGVAKIAAKHNIEEVREANPAVGTSSMKTPAKRQRKESRSAAHVTSQEKTMMEVSSSHLSSLGYNNKRPADSLSHKDTSSEDETDNKFCFDDEPPYQELEAGCVIQYYDPMSVAGNPDALRTETVIQVQRRQSVWAGEDDEVILTMNNGDILCDDYPVKVVKAFVGDELVECESPLFRCIDTYEIIESKTRSLGDVIMGSASSFKEVLGQNMKKKSPKGMPGDILHPALMELSMQNSTSSDKDDDVIIPAAHGNPGDDNIRRRRSLKLEKVMKQRTLDLEQQGIVNDALYGAGPWHEVLASNGGDDVTREHMERLRPGIWLSDVIVNYFLKKCLQQRDERMHRNDSNRKRSHFFTSFFMQNLFDELNGNANLKGQYNYRNVRSWYRYVPGRNIFNLKCIFFPTNIGNNHWTLTVAFMEEKRIQYYDSFKGVGKGEKYLKGVLGYLKDEHQRLFKSDMDTSAWRLVRCTEDTQQQTKYNEDNDFDCGAFVCLFADFIAMDCAPIFDFDEDCIEKYREWIAVAIKTNCVTDYILE